MSRSVEGGAFYAPDIYDKEGAGWKKSTVEAYIAKELTLPTGKTLTRTAKKMETDYETASKITADATKMFSENMAQLEHTLKSLQDTIRKTSGSVRKSTEELAQGMVRIQKHADFNNLEKYASLLERASVAMTTLAELEKAGKLERIAEALK